MRRSLLNKRILPKPLRQALVLITLLLLPSAAWADYTYGSDEELNYDDYSHLFKSGLAPIWTVSMDGNSASWPAYIQDTSPAEYSPFTGFNELTLTRLDRLKGELTGFALEGKISSSANVNIIIYKLATKDATERTKIGTVTINDGTTPTYTYTAENGVSQVFNNQYIQLAFEHAEGDASSIAIDDIEKIILTFSGISYGLKIDDVRVTSNNAEDILGDGDGNVSYSSNTLTLKNGVNLQKIRYSGSDNLTIAFDGTVSISSSDTVTIVSTSDLPKLLFSSTNGSLNLSGNGVIGGFSDVDFGNLNLASISDPGIYWNKNKRKMQDITNSASNATITTEKYYPIWIHDRDKYTQLREEGESAITIYRGVDSDEQCGTISFDGEHTITISGVSFNYSNNTLIVVGPSMSQLTVKLSGESTGGEATTILNLWDTTPLTFTTEESTVSLSAPSIISWYSEDSQSQGGQISYENGLVYNYDTSTTYTETISTTGARIKIGGAGSETVISGSTDENGLFDGTVFFDASNNTLTLKGATLGNIDSYGIKVFVDNLTVKIDEGNSIYGVIQYEGINKSSLIQIEKADKATSASLTLSNIQGFRSCTWSDDLYLSADNGDDVVDVYYDPDAKVNSIPIGMMVSYYGGTIANITFSTEEFNAIWVAGNIVTGTGNVEGVGISSDLGTVYYDSSSHTLTLNGASIYTNESNPSPLIICNGDLTVNLVNENHINFSGNYSTYVFKNNSSTGQITFNSGGEGASLSITSSFYEGTYKGLCDGFSTVNFNNDLGLFNYSGSKAIKNVTGHAPGFYLDNGVCYWSTEGLLLNATYYYKIDYVDTSKEGSGVEVDLETDETNWGFGGANFNSSDLLGPCTITTYSKVNGTIIGSNKAKLFAIADNTITLNSTTLNSELTIDIQPAIEEGDGVSLTITNSFNPVVIQVEEGTATIVGIGECNLDASLAVLSSSSLTVLNTREGDVVRLSTKVTVLPDKPSIEKDTEHDYLETDKITITRTSVDGEDANDLKIFYTWDKDIVVETYQQYTEGDLVSIYDPNEKIPAQTGTLRAWVGYHAGDNCFYNSEVVSEEFTVYKIAEMEWESESQTYGTYYNPDKDMAVPSGSTAYIVTGISEDGTKVTISPVSYIKAGVAVLIERNKTTEVSKTTDFSASKMNYSDPNTPAQPSATDNWYVIYNNKFVKVTEGTQVKGGKCYLNLSSSVANTRGFYNIGDGEGTTAIREVRSEGVNSEKLADGAWHDLQGRKFTTKPTKPGLYILNGKKIVIK